MDDFLTFSRCIKIHRIQSGILTGNDIFTCSLEVNSSPEQNSSQYKNELRIASNKMLRKEEIKGGKYVLTIYMRGCTSK